MEKQLLEMKLHEDLAIDCGSFVVKRVMGGWIYYGWNYTKDEIIHPGTFVPYPKGEEEDR